MSETQSLCGSEVTRKIKQLEVERGHIPFPNIEKLTTWGFHDSISRKK